MHAQLWLLHQSHLFWIRDSPYNHSYLGYHMKQSLKSIQKLRLVQNAVLWAVMGTPLNVQITPALHKLPQDYASRFNPRCWWSPTKSFMALGRIICEIALPQLYPPISSDPAWEAYYRPCPLKSHLAGPGRDPFLSWHPGTSFLQKSDWSWSCWPFASPWRHHSTSQEARAVARINPPPMFLSVDQILYLRFVLPPLDLPYFCRIGIKSLVWGAWNEVP